jgi:hypothetical protein
MRSGFILREQPKSNIIPRPDLGVFCSRKNAKRAAKRRGFPIELIKKVTRHDPD